MTEKQTETLAAIVGGEAWQSGGGVWLVTLRRRDGAVVAFSGDAICEYKNEEAFDQSHASTTIVLDEDGNRWVISDRDGNTFYRDDHLEIGWSCEVDARREARALESRTGERYLVREQ